MPWVRSGDTSATYPLVMSVRGLPGADGRSINEVFGFISRLAMLSAAHTTDYIVDAGTVDMIGGENTTALLALCIKVGLLKKTRINNMAAYKVIDDPEFLHLRLKAEIDWTRQQQADGKNEALTVPIRLRDGDQCRYCGVMVRWVGRPSQHSATFDHLDPGNAGTVDTMVVACRGCNSELRDIAGREVERLNPPPAEPFYSEFTADWLTSRGRPVAATERPDIQSDTAKKTRKKVTPRQRTGTQSDTAPSDSDPAKTGPRAHPATAESRLKPGLEVGFGDLPVAIGMDSTGQGRDGSGKHPPPSTPPSSSRDNPAGTRRRKRSPRGRNRPGGNP